MRLVRRIPLTPFGWALVTLVIALALAAVIIGSALIAGLAAFWLLMILALLLPASPGVHRFGTSGRFRTGDLLTDDRGEGRQRP